MAQKSEQDESNSELRQKIAHSREHMARDLRGLRYELDFPMKFRRSFQRSTLLWIGAAAVVGIVFAFMPARTKKVYVAGKKKNEQGKKFLEAGFVVAAAKLAASLLKPVVVGYLTKRMRGAGGKARSAKNW
ncbi:MAG TPA: hypothetical protein VIL70_06570 [Chthoniobacterales bacterium]|jgi:hypothetical protein